MSDSRGATGGGLGSGLVAAAAVLIAVGAGLAWVDLRSRLDRLDDRVQKLNESSSHLSETMQLYRLEQSSKQGLGLSALLDQLCYWAPRLSNAATPAAERPAIQERLVAIVEAMRALDPHHTGDRLLTALASSDDPEVQRWLLRTLVEIDRDRGMEVLDRIVRGLDMHASPVLRIFAADELTRLDRERAGRALRAVLTAETHRGVDASRLTAGDRERLTAAPTGNNEQFYLFVDRYVATGDPEASEVLLMILGRANEHDPLTVQEAVKALGKLHSSDAAQPIQNLFEVPPRNMHPMFRTHCLDALAAIEGTGALDYFRTALHDEQSEMVRRKLEDLISKLGG